MEVLCRFAHPPGNPGRLDRGVCAVVISLGKCRVGAVVGGPAPACLRIALSSKIVEESKTTPPRHPTAARDMRSRSVFSYSLPLASGDCCCGDEEAAERCGCGDIGVGFKSYPVCRCVIEARQQLEIRYHGEQVRALHMERAGDRGAREDGIVIEVLEVNRVPPCLPSGGYI